ncbi:hypothetical protein GCM10010515_41350 [Streptomyces fructofermentans]|uniref:Uncharacterized protein n=1 Tax=Streptomyces fructofermentans TaxID=152141 RepID=A0A918KP54_9ACTN|nr:hypothetical protein GCM10010515_41350 [Streptomyces fructofermentans]
MRAFGVPAVRPCGTPAAAARIAPPTDGARGDRVSTESGPVHLVPCGNLGLLVEGWEPKVHERDVKYVIFCCPPVALTLMCVLRFRSGWSWEAAAFGGAFVPLGLFGAAWVAHLLTRSGS